MPRDNDLRYERERELRIKAVQAQLNQQEKATRVGLFWLSISAAIVFIGAGYCLVNL
jgi:hypothetical protein